MNYIDLEIIFPETNSNIIADFILNGSIYWKDVRVFVDKKRLYVGTSIIPGICYKYYYYD